MQTPDFILLKLFLFFVSFLFLFLSLTKPFIIQMRIILAETGTEFQLDNSSLTEPNE